MPPSLDRISAELAVGFIRGIAAIAELKSSLGSNSAESGGSSDEPLAGA